MVAMLTFCDINHKLTAWRFFVQRAESTPIFAICHNIVVDYTTPGSLGSEHT